ncbi:hypothetical protein OC25_23835 [Pedobacter kyungheensis]|uniref:Uncharacterized protein n=1 Tax=Pedobacter kyungheensis TaxID=1069985 RepID=A0A0C1FGJ1_9SPHI|nr:hypothetical protein [Pedobacter kyungheensis]KIA90933.1 hypothetical protein OC25_23835 [Pedobacter kyungheensis]
MKEKHLEALEERNLNTRKIKTPNVKGGKYKGNPHMKFKKVKTEPRQKIRQLLRASIPLEDLSAITKSKRISPSH